MFVKEREELREEVRRLAETIEELNGDEESVRSMRSSTNRNMVIHRLSYQLIN